WITRGQSCESEVSSRQLVGPWSVWQLTMTCRIFAGRRPKSARCRSRIPFFFGSTLGYLVIVVPGGGASASSPSSVFFGWSFGFSAAPAFFTSAFLATASSFFFASFFSSVFFSSVFFSSVFFGSSFFAAGAGLSATAFWVAPVLASAFIGVA